MPQQNEVMPVNLGGTEIPALVEGIKKDLKDGLEAFYRAGCKLLNLREEFKTLKPQERKDLGGFAEFCQRQTGISRPMYGHLTRSVVAVDNLKTATKVALFPTHETQVRPLTKFNKDPETQAIVWNKAVDLAGGNQPTEEDVKAAIDRVEGEQAREGEGRPGAQLRC